uniref:HD_domain domain-containing protein n=1 Tax=Heterorhabditis bacteriophora TaxID=37862 RepID=A0A1I7WLS9_HETBA
MKHYLRNEFKPGNKEQLHEGIRKFWKERMTIDQCIRYVSHIQKVMPIVVEYFEIN